MVELLTGGGTHKGQWEQNVTTALGIYRNPETPFTIIYPTHTTTMIKSRNMVEEQKDVHPPRPIRLFSFRPNMMDRAPGLRNPEW